MVPRHDSQNRKVAAPALLWFGASCLAQALCVEPLGIGQVMEMLNGGVLPLRVRTLVLECGVDFQLNADSEQGLWEAGAGDLLIETIRERTRARARATPSAPAPGGAWVLVPAGEFLMGCVEEDPACADAEKAPRRVRIPRPFEIARHEVTQQEREAVMDHNPSQFKGGRLPVEGVSWDEAQTYLARLNEREDGYRYRLPAEAEREYAARAGISGRAYGELTGIAWYSGNSTGQTHHVGTREPNAWGLDDVLGNVWEWCQDPFDETSNRRVLRGGSWYSPARVLRFSRRFDLRPGMRTSSPGFLVVRERTK